MELTEREEAAGKKILIYFYGNEASTWNVNEKVLKILCEMIEKSKYCSEAMDLLPRPGIPLTPQYLRKQLVDIAKRLNSGEHTYEICKAAISAGYRTSIRLAAMGL